MHCICSMIKIQWVDKNLKDPFMDRVSWMHAVCHEFIFDELNQFNFF